MWFLRDIPVYEGWVDDNSASFGHNVDEFVVALQDIIDGKVDKREEGYKVAESRSIDDVAKTCWSLQRSIGDLNAYRIVYRYLFSTGIRCCD